MSIFTQRHKIALVLNPTTNICGAGTDATPVSLKDYSHVTFLIPLGAKNTGTAVITVKKAQDIAKTGATAIDFRIGHNEGQATADTLSDPAYNGNVNGFTTNDTDDQLYAIEIDGRELGETYDVVYPHFAQGAAGNIAGSVIAILSEGRFLGQNSYMPSALS